MRSLLTGQHYSRKIYSVVSHMVQHISVQFVLIRTVFVLTTCIVAYHCSFFHHPPVKHLSIQVQKSPILQGQVGYWVLSVSHSRLKVVLPVDLVKPDCEFCIPNSWTPKSIQVCNFRPVRQQMGCCVSSNSCSQTVSCYSKLVFPYITF